MAEIHAAAEGIVAAPAADVYAYIADHRRHHPNFLPDVFSDYRVEEGGVGAGTIVRYKVKAGGRKREYRARIDEPEPGRVIAETLLDGNGSVTTFTVDPAQGGSRVRIETQWRAAGGVQGLVERAFVPGFLKKVYVDELERLDRYAREQAVRSE